MNPSEQLKQLRAQIAKGSITAGEIAQELRSLLDFFNFAADKAPYREKIRNAITWAEIHGKRSNKPNHHGGYDRVQQCLLEDIAGATSWAERLQNAAGEFKAARLEQPFAADKFRG